MRIHKLLYCGNRIVLYNNNIAQLNQQKHAVLGTLHLPHTTTRSMSTWWPVKGIYIYIYRRPIYINTTCEYVISIRYVLSSMPQGPCNCGTLISDVDVSYCGVCLMLSYSAVRFSGLEFNRPLRRTTLTHVPAIIYSSLCLRCIIIIVIIFSVCALCVNHVQYFTNIEVLLFPISA